MAVREDLEEQVGRVFGDSGGTINVMFTKGDSPYITKPNYGHSAYTSLWEETYHAWDHQTGGLDLSNPTALDEAQAWKFAANAPGTKFNFSQTIGGVEYYGTTVMGRIKNASENEVANWLYFGAEIKFVGAEINRRQFILPNIDNNGSGLYFNIKGGLGTVIKPNSKGASDFERKKYLSKQ
jgi:hypothetical protein